MTAAHNINMQKQSCAKLKAGYGRNRYAGVKFDLKRGFVLGYVCFDRVEVELKS